MLPERPVLALRFDGISLLHGSWRRQSGAVKCIAPSCAWSRRRPGAKQDLGLFSAPQWTGGRHATDPETKAGALVFERAQEGDRLRSSRVRDQHRAMGSNAALHNGSEHAMHRRFIKNIGADDDVIALGVGPMCPVRRKALDTRKSVFPFVARGDPECVFSLVGLVDARA